MPAIIYDKKTEETFDQGTGDKCFILEPKKAYQVPFPFATWDRMRLGVIWSWTSTTGDSVDADGQYNTPISDYTDSTGVVQINPREEFDDHAVLKEYSFFGISKKQPVARGNFSDFVGWRGNVLYLSNVTNDTSGVLNKLGDTGISSDLNYSGININPSNFIWSTGRESVVDSQAVYTANGSVGSIAPRIYGLKNPNPSGISPEGEENFASFWGIEVNVVNRSNKHSYEVLPLYYNDSSLFLEDGVTVLNYQYNPNCKINNLSKENIKKIVYGGFLKNETPTAVENKINLDNPAAPIYNPAVNSEFNQNNLPNSLFLYNGFDDINIRIHSWVVISIK